MSDYVYRHPPVICRASRHELSVKHPDHDYGAAAAYSTHPGVVDCIMIWTVLGTIAFIAATVAYLLVLDMIGFSTGLFAWLFAHGIWKFAGTMENKGADDPVYKKNLQRLIERNRQFEEDRNSSHS
jgi:hypothetical protein